MLVAPRRFAVLPIIIMACFITPAQRVVILSLNFDMLRLMVIVGWLRLLVRGEIGGLTRKPVDILIVIWSIVMTAVYSARTGTAVYMLGMSFDSLGMYFLFRHFIRSGSDIQRIATYFAVISIPVCMAFLYEHYTGRNVFAVFGYVPAITDVRDGKLRCQGAFAHPILAGCFWATVMPVMVANFFFRGKLRLFAIAGIVASLLIVVLCASSTPMMALLFGLLGGVMFFVRSWMRWIRRGIVLSLIGAQLLMTKPFWHLLARIDVVGGSTGWYRYLLIDEALSHIAQWGLFGASSTASWGISDITSQYILYGLYGGLAAVILFVGIIICGYSGVGAAMRAHRDCRSKQILAWALGVALFQHTMNFIVVSYFQQIIMVWFLLLAMIAAITPRNGDGSRSRRRHAEHVVRERITPANSRALQL